jgi:CubicO group peptidase (beta-lactamase class C family)
MIGSLSKSFTAVAVLQLVEAGRVELDAPIQRYLPSFTLSDPDVATRVTVRELLNHTSGLADTGFIAGFIACSQTSRRGWTAWQAPV